MARTLGQLVDDIRSRLGIPSTDNFKTQAEIAQMIQASAHELHDLVNQAMGDEALIASSTFSASAGVHVYVLNTQTHPIHSLIRVSVAFDGRHRPLRKANLETDEYDETATAWTSATDIRYRFNYAYADPANSFDSAGTIRFYPTPNGIYQVALTYRLRPPFVTASATAQINSIGFDEYIILDCCAKYATAEERDPSQYLLQKEAFARRIELMAPPKDAGQPSYIHDVRSTEDWERW